MADDLGGAAARAQARAASCGGDPLEWVPDLRIYWMPADTDFRDRNGAHGQRGVLVAYERGLHLNVVRSLDRDDWVLERGLYLMSMERMVSRGRDALLFEAQLGRGPDGGLVILERLAARGAFIHHVGRTRLGLQRPVRPSMLDACVGAGLELTEDGVGRAVDAQDQLHAALGGWRRGRKFLLDLR